MKLVLGAADGLTKVSATFFALRTWRSQFVEKASAVCDVSRESAEGFPDVEIVAEGLIGTGDDVLADGLAFHAVSGEEGGGSKAAVHVGYFPGQVESILDTGVGAKAVKRWVAVDRVTKAETKGRLFVIFMNER